MSVLRVRGSIPEVVRNDSGLYEGDLRHYFQVLLNRASNLYAPYHNLRHMLHITWMCHEALKYYDSVSRTFTRQEARVLLIAGMFHDFDHTGRAGKDAVNIELAVQGLKENILREDRHHLDEIVHLIRLTEYPYSIPTHELTLDAQILRDADMSQTLSPVWIQQIIVGLGQELGKSPIEMLRMQTGFLGKLKFHSHWGRQLFTDNLIYEKTVEAEELLGLLEA